MSVEFGKDIPSQEWEYLEDALDQGIVFGAWGPYKRKSPHEGGFVHRIQLNNNSRNVASLVQSNFGGKIKEQMRPYKDFPFQRPYFIWTITNPEEGLVFVEQTGNRLHFKGELAEKYADFLKALKKEGVEDKLKDFNDAKNAPPSTDLYIPTPRKLAARLDVNGFVGIQMKSPDSPSTACADVYLGTPYPGLGLGIEKGYGGKSTLQDESYLWRASEDTAVKVLQKVLPDLRNMRERAILVLEFEDINKLLARRGRGGKQRDLLLEALRQGDPRFDRADLLRLGYIEKSRMLNANPV